MNPHREITALEIELLREEQLVYMPQLVKIRRRQFFGDNESAYETIAEKVRTRITPGFGFWRVVADRFQGITAFTITMPWNQDCRAGDVVIDSMGNTYEIRDAKNPSTYHTALQLLADKVND
jgi:hypothetical protein